MTTAAPKSIHGVLMTTPCQRTRRVGGRSILFVAASLDDGVGVVPIVAHSSVAGAILAAHKAGDRIIVNGVPTRRARSRFDRP